MSPLSFDNECTGCNMIASNTAVSIMSRCDVTVSAVRPMLTQVVTVECRTSDRWCSAVSSVE